MERTAKLLLAIACSATLPLHVVALAILFMQREVANGIVSALLLFFGIAAAKAFYTLRYSTKRILFSSVPKLRLAPRAQLLLAAAATAITSVSLGYAINAYVTAGPYHIPLGTVTFLCALFYLVTLLAAFTERKEPH